MADQVLTCKDCGDTFKFTDGEQEFFKQQKFTPPKRCPECRKAKRENKKKY